MCSLFRPSSQRILIPIVSELIPMIVRRWHLPGPLVDGIRLLRCRSLHLTMLGKRGFFPVLAHIHFCFPRVPSVCGTPVFVPRDVRGLGFLPAFHLSKEALCGPVSAQISLCCSGF